jgi:putative membrane protein insertion efficiency factor
MNKIFIFFIKFYQKNISIYKKPTCVFYPSCSEYSKQAFLKHKFFKALFLSIKRISKCHPFSKPQIDKLK